MTGQQLKEYKNIYTDIIVPDTLIEKKWSIQSEFLPNQELKRKSYQFMPYGAVFLSAFLVLFILSIAIVQASKPGNLLYPVNTWTQQLSKKVSSTFQVEENSFNPPKIHTATNSLKRIPTPTAKPTVTSIPNPTEKLDLKNNFRKEKDNNTGSQSDVLGTQSEKEITHSPTSTTTHENTDNSKNIKSNGNGINATSENSHSNHTSNNNSKSDHGNTNK